jgi:hypothetical protein
VVVHDDVGAGGFDVRVQVRHEAVGHLDPHGELLEPIEVVPAGQQVLDAGLGPRRTEAGDRQPDRLDEGRERRRHHDVDVVPTTGQLLQQRHHRVEVTQPG